MQNQTQLYFVLSEGQDNLLREKKYHKIPNIFTSSEAARTYMSNQKDAKLKIVVANIDDMSILNITYQRNSRVKFTEPWTHLLS